MGLIQKRRLAQLAAIPLIVFGLAGCSLDFTGGGTIPSTDATGTDQANFGFSYHVTNPSTGAGHAQGVYHDSYAPSFPNGGVQLKFDGLLNGDTSPGSICSVNGIFGQVNYISQNPAYPGSGTAYLTACDNGQPGVANDGIAIFVLSGPYTNYGNAGLLTGGNLKAH
jgi:hypothetical protein